MAEDNEVNRLVATAMLTKAGFDVDTVENGADAVEASRWQGYDAILMDCQMPVMDGYEAARRIRDRGDRIPIIALTASVLKEDVDRCFAAGMDDYLSKPVSAATLAEVISRRAAPRGQLRQTPAAADQEPLLDRPFLVELAQLERPGNSFRLSSLLAGFLDEMPDRLEELERAVVSADLEQLGETAHRFRGASAVIGARAVAAACGRLEEAARHRDAAEARSQLETVRELVERTRRELAEIDAGPGADDA